LTYGPQKRSADCGPGVK